MSQSHRRHLRLDGVPVLAYHGVARNDSACGAPDERDYWVSEEQLRSHVRAIVQAGWHVAGLDEFCSSGLSNERPSTLALTFDDGNGSDYEIAYPLLAAAAIPAIFFVNPSTIGTAGRLDWAQIREMQRSGLSFQSHGYDHTSFTGLSPVELAQSLRGSKQAIEDRLGCEVHSVAAPYGDWNPEIFAAARECGYRYLWRTRAWPAKVGRTLVNRVCVLRNTTAAEVARLAAGDVFAYLRRAAHNIAVYGPRRGLVWLTRDLL